MPITRTKFSALLPRLVLRDSVYQRVRATRRFRRSPLNPRPPPSANAPLEQESPAAPSMFPSLRRQPLLHRRPGQHHLPGPRALPLSLRRPQQPARPRRVQDIADRHALPRRRTPAQSPAPSRSHLRRRIRRRPRHLGGARPRRLHQSRRRPQPHPRLHALSRPRPAAPDHRPLRHAHRSRARRRSLSPLRSPNAASNSASAR